MRTATFLCLEIQCCGSYSNHNHGHSAGILHPRLRRHSSKCSTYTSKNRTKALLFLQ